MAKRLQISLSDAQYRELQAAARRRGQTTAEWVRAALRAACGRASRGEVDRKLAAIRAAARHRFPTVGIDAMLAQIESGLGTANS